VLVQYLRKLYTIWILCDDEPEFSSVNFNLQDSHRAEFIKQLIPTSQPLTRINVKFFGHSGVGKSTLIESLRAGYFCSLFRKSKPATNSASGTSKL
jgi:GTP-binding protein EngB required for normal cell division